jgi:bacterioferritin
MSREANALRFTYNMERFAKQIYLTQRGAFRGSEVEERLKRASENEWQHVEYLQERITGLGESPSRLGWLFQTAGRIAGLISRCPGRLFILRADIWIERRAIKDYGDYLERLDFDEETVGLIRRIIADEERHVETWQNSIEIVKGKEKASESK